MQITLQQQPHLYPLYASLHTLLITVTEIYPTIVTIQCSWKTTNNTKTSHYIDYSNPPIYHITKSHNSINLSSS